ncbi:Uncharacterized protein TCM_004374 [Theobroma cacao]|uniref:Integrase catalytic domain-containing protein n=1 Tax=Theobroma cacao TaxID=3641 RepID=A0A061DQT5_THECC|nr:Uncharacterized protein TCM_004374 [Theobroma cacao]
MNRHANTFTALASKIQMQEEDQSTISVLKRSKRLAQSKLYIYPTIKVLHSHPWCVYHKGGNGVLARCISNHEVEEKLKEMYAQWCGEERPPLHRLLERARHTWILIAIKCFTKWVRVVPSKNAIGSTVANFIKENIICRFGIPKRILSDNGILFVNFSVNELLAFYDVDHVKSILYYPKINGQAEATNKTLLKMLNIMVHDDLNM